MYVCVFVRACVFVCVCVQCVCTHARAHTHTHTHTHARTIFSYVGKEGGREKRERMREERERERERERRERRERKKREREEREERESERERERRERASEREREERERKRERERESPVSPEARPPTGSFDSPKALNPRTQRGHNVRWIRLADHMVCRCPAESHARRTVGPRLLLLVPARSDLGEPPSPRARTVLVRVNGFNARDPSGQRSPPFRS